MFVKYNEKFLQNNRVYFLFKNNVKIMQLNAINFLYNPFFTCNDYIVKCNFFIERLMKKVSSCKDLNISF